MALNQIKITGKAPSTPTAGPFAPNAGDSEIIYRVGSYDSFASGSPETSINVAWGGNTDTVGGAYDTNNILIHHIKVTNEEILAPKVSAIIKNGNIISMPLEDMTPLLPIKLLKEEMYFKLSKESFNARKSLNKD